MPDATQHKFEATLQYSAPLMRRVVFAFWRRTVGLSFPIVLIALAALSLAWIYLDGMNWFLALFIAVIVLAALLVVAIFVTHYRHTLARFHKLEHPQATLVVNREHLAVTSELGSSTVPWHAVSEIWQFPDFWLVMFSKSQFMTLPLVGLSEEIQRFILDHVDGSRGETR